MSPMRCHHLKHYVVVSHSGCITLLNTSSYFTDYGGLLVGIDGIVDIYWTHC